MSDKALRVAIAIASLIGVGISIYLTYIHYRGIAPICTAGGGCETVQESQYAVLFGVPVATYGLVGDLAIFASALLKHRLAIYAGFLLSLTGVMFTLYLTYLELFVIHAVCLWCVVHGLIILTLLVLTTVRFVRYEVS